MEKMPIYLQGEGTYDYECRDRNCWHCEMMGKIPSPQIYFESEIPKETIKTIVKIQTSKIKYQTWRQVEILQLIENKFMPPKEMCKMFPYRTRMAVLTRVSRLRRDGVLPKI